MVGPGDTRNRLGVASFSVDAFSATEVCRHLDSHGVALRGGHHCAQLLIRALGVEGVAPANLASYSLDSDVDALLHGLDELVRAGGAPSKRRRRMLVEKRYPACG